MLNQFIEYANNILYEEFVEGNPIVLKFLKERNLDEADMDKYNLGFIRKNNSVPKFMVDNKEYYSKIKLLSESGINVRGRIIIPSKNIHGEYSMVACRSMNDNAGQKYLTIKDFNFNKDEILYGYYENRNNILSENRVILVEGQFDYIYSDKMGLNYTVAISGSSFTIKHLELINNISNGVDIIFATDNDLAGRKCIEEALFKFPELYDRMYYIVYGKDNDDPDKYFREGGTIDEFMNGLKPIREFFNYTDMNLSERVSLTNKFLKRCNSIEGIFGIFRLFKDTMEKSNVLEFKLISDRVITEDDYIFSKLLCKELGISHLKRQLFFSTSRKLKDESNFQNRSEYYFYVGLLKKNLKTFDNVGKYCYLIFHRNTRSFILERYIASWWMDAYNKGFGKYDRFPFDKILTKHNAYFDKDEVEISIDKELIGLEEIYEVPEFNEYGEIVGYYKSNNFTQKLFQHLARLYEEKQIEWSNE